MNPSDMNRQDQRDLYEELSKQLVEIEKQMEDKTLSHSDQQLLDQAWEDIVGKMEELDEVFEMQEDADAADEQERINEWEDTREGCKHCSGCMYCLPGYYDGNDEV